MTIEKKKGVGELLTEYLEYNDEQHINQAFLTGFEIKEAIEKVYAYGISKCTRECHFGDHNKGAELYTKKVVLKILDLIYEERVEELEKEKNKLKEK